MTADGTDDDSEMAAAMAEMEAGGGADADDDMAAAMAEMDGGAAGDDNMAAAIAETDAGGGGAGLPGPGGDQAGYDVPVELSAVLGTAQIPVSQLLKMGRGAVLELDRIVGDPIDIYIDKQMVGRGDVIVLEEKLGITLNDTIRTPSK
jgi:flagellar motor switch protein FliN/FliY